MKWGTKYGPDYVNNLRAMVRRHLTLPHRLICFTDDGRGLEAGIEVMPLPAMDLAAGKERGWRKLSTFTAPLADLKGPVLFLDVDILIVGSLDCFFDHPGRFCIIRDWAKPWRGTGNSSVYRFEANAHPDLLAHFLAQADQVKREVRNEQEYLTREIHRQEMLTFWPGEWCVSFKYHCLPRFPLNFFRTPRLPTNARVVVFHGHPLPEEAIAGRNRNLLRRPRPTPWIADHWR